MKLPHEGNAHQAEFTRDNRYFIGTDEDFETHRPTGTIVDGPSAGHALTLEWGSVSPRLTPESGLAGGTRAVGTACDPAAIPPADTDHTIAVVERGACFFNPKADNVMAKGYTGAIFFNRTGEAGCDAPFASLVQSGIPVVTVTRTDAFRILNQSLDGYSCAESGAGTLPPPPGTDGARVQIRATFDGWGYVHLFDRVTNDVVDRFTIPEGQEVRYADGFGDLAVHEVATDPDVDLAYLSYYGGGLRILSTAGGDLHEVGAYIAGTGFTTTSGRPVTQHGNNFWGIEVHKHPNGQKYILASDRDSGLWIFQYRP